MQLLPHSEIFDAEKNPQFWVLVDVLFYTVCQLQCSHMSRYEIVILLLLDLFLFVVKDEQDKLKIFHHLPKVFTLHLRGHPVIIIGVVAALAAHFVQHHRQTKSILFFLSVTCAVFFASFGAGVVLMAALEIGIVAAYMYMWETTYIAPPKTDDDLKIEQLLQKEDTIMRDHAIAQDLVTKLKKLRVALTHEKDNLKKQTDLADKESRDGEGDKEAEKEEDLVLKNMLDLDELSQLIEILVSQSSQEMKYWLPKDIMSVLNNEEVSAYLWAYLNTQDMMPSTSNVKKLIKYSRADSFSGHSGTALGEDYSFDLFTFDKNNIHQDSLVIGCSQIYKKFK